MSGSEIGNFVEARDRLEMAAYELTGDAFVGQAAQLHGSICWWDCPDGTPPNQNDQSFLAAVDIQLVIDERPPNQSVFRAAETFLLRRIEQMIEWARSEAVTVQAKVGNVSELVSEIAALKPWTMSWSNVCDYYQADEFHRIARACSIHGDTIHFAYSMNWSNNVFGSHIIDVIARGRSQVVKQRDV
jgi:hypothetical protein|eukprot:1113340-Prymnesium_polylepis.2